ncbi:MAG: sigma-70 family RNA polymerase sigma factor [Treponema sp.]|nr:sigma-70 family RNA polymerase sigma factor [Treponema sp.]
MDKQIVDKITAKYMEKIFGFALTKTMNTEKAEELASRITFDLYQSLLKCNAVENIDGYVYRVARNVYARFVDEEVRGRHLSFDEMVIPCENDFTIDFEKDETYIRLRREVSYLGKIQREIVVMHYFQKLKLFEIAQKLKISLGTVKWHLHDARNQIKEGIQMRDKGTLGLMPVRFSEMGHSGRLGPDGKDTAYYLSKLISQNIAYAAYHKARTITEIAGVIGVPAAFVEDEVAHLEDNGFMDKIAGGRYLTNIRIHEPSKERLEQEHTIYTKYAKIVCDKYVPLVFERMAAYDKKRIYSPENDFNFLMWSAVTYACGRGHELRVSDLYNDLSRYCVKRKDGGEYVAYALVDGFNWEDLSFNANMYSCGDEDRFGYSPEGKPYPVYAWQCSSYYDDRSGHWRDNLNNDYSYLYEYMTGKISKDPSHADKFKRLYDKGYIVSKGNTEYVNMIITTMSESEFSGMLPAIPEELKAIGEELDAEIYKINKAQYPAHMQDLCRIVCQNCLSKKGTQTRVLEQLAANGTLKPLTDTQKRSVNTIMFCDVLPKENEVIL